MENASKALIIAGAILVSILLISIGVVVVNLINPVTEEVEGLGTSTAVQTFNSKFTNYEGEGKKGAEVKSFVNLVNSTKGTREITLVWGKKATDTLSAVKVKSQGSYTIEFEYDAEGYIDKAHIYNSEYAKQ